MVIYGGGALVLNGLNNKGDGMSYMDFESLLHDSELVGDEIREVEFDAKDSVVLIGGFTDEPILIPLIDFERILIACKNRRFNYELILRGKI